MFKILSKSLREYKDSAILTGIFAMLEVALEVAIPFLMAMLIDKGVTPGNVGYIIVMGIILIALSLASLVAGTQAGKGAAVASVGFSSNLRKDIFYKVQDFSFTNIDKFSSSSIVTRLTTDVGNVQMAFFMIIRMAIRTFSMVLFAMIMTFVTNAKVARIYLVMVPFLGLALFLMIRMVYPIFNRVFQKYDGLNRIVQENLRGIRVVKSFVREDYEIKKFKKASNDIYGDFVTAEKLAALTSPFLQFCIYASIVALAWFGAKSVVAGDMTTGNIFSMITYTFQIMINVMMLSMVMVMITIARTSGERIAEILEEESSITSPDSPVTGVKNGDIEFVDVGFSYGGDPENLCLMDVNLKINSGETVGIIGATGSSKSTLVQLIPRIYEATLGEVLVGGINVKSYDLTALRDQVAMVLQKNVLFSGTVRENLLWGNPNATEEEIIKAAKLAQADDFIAKMEEGYDSHVEQGGVNFSGGQQQRLCIARALVKRPMILILDDSTSAVDTKTDASIREALYTEIPDTTKIIIAQRIASVESADKIIIMDNGRIQEIGTHNGLLKTNDMYKGLYDSQVKGGEEVE